MSATNTRSVPDLLTTGEAAEHLRVSIPTLERMRLAGNGPAFIKMGAGLRGRVVYRREDLDTYVLSRRRLSTSDRGDAQ